MNVAKVAGAVWMALFGITLTLIMGFVVWVLAGPLEASLIFALVVVLFVVLPMWVARRR